MGKAIHDLVQEHEKILQVLDIIRKVQANDKISVNKLIEFYSELADFIEIFADKCHHGKEEHNLYHTLAPLGDELERNMIIYLIKEHEEAKAINNQIRRAAEEGRLSEATTAAAKYRKLLLEHIHNENEELFPAIDKRITLEQEEVIYEHFLAVEKRYLGEDGITRIDNMIEKWEKELLS
jgi:hemerythrin-like domain-containing protein